METYIALNANDNGFGRRKLSGGCCAVVGMRVVNVRVGGAVSSGGDDGSDGEWW